MAAIQGPPRFSGGAAGPQSPADWTALQRWFTQIQLLTQGLLNAVTVAIDDANTNPPSQEIDFTMNGTVIAKLRYVTPPYVPETAIEFRLIGIAGWPAIYSLIGPDGVKYADWTYDGNNDDMDVSSGSMNLRPLDGVGSVNVWSPLGNVKLKVGNLNLTQAIYFYNDGANSHIGTTAGNVEVDQGLQVVGNILAASFNDVVITYPGGTATITIALGKTLTVDNSITFEATADGETLNIAGGGTLGPYAYLATILPTSQAQPSRAFGTVYRNATAYPVYVTVSVSFAGAATVHAVTDASATPSTVVASAQAPATSTVIPLTFIVLPGNYYEIVLITGSATATSWTEWN